MVSKVAKLSRWNVAWSSWVAMFVTIETLALRSKNHQATLSYHTAQVFGFGQKAVPLPTMGRRTIGMAAWVWFLIHVLRWENKNDHCCT